MTAELEEWASLVTHPGWLRLRQWASREFGDRVLMGVEQAANDRDDVLALNKLRQVIAARKAVEAVMSWPEQRMRTLQTQPTGDPMPSFSRRGGL